MDGCLERRRMRTYRPHRPSFRSLFAFNYRLPLVVLSVPSLLAASTQVGERLRVSAGAKEDVTKLSTSTKALIIAGVALLGLLALFVVSYAIYSFITARNRSRAVAKIDAEKEEGFFSEPDGRCLLGRYSSAENSEGAIRDY